MSTARASCWRAADSIVYGFLVLCFAILWAALMVWLTRGALAWQGACGLGPGESFGRIVSELRYPRSSADCGTLPQGPTP